MGLCRGINQAGSAEWSIDHVGLVGVDFIGREGGGGRQQINGGHEKGPVWMEHVHSLVANQLHEGGKKVHRPGRATDPTGGGAFGVKLREER